MEEGREELLECERITAPFVQPRIAKFARREVGAQPGVDREGNPGKETHAGSVPRTPDSHRSLLAQFSCR